MLLSYDTSVFIDYLRSSSGDALAVLTLNNQVLLSPIVRLELLAGVKKKQSAIIDKLCKALRNIDSFASPAECEKLLKRARGSGLFGGIPDLLIIADSIRHKAPLYTLDMKMKKLARKLGAKLIEL